MEKILVLGNGTFGCALAELLHNNGYEVALWGRNKEKNKKIKQEKKNSPKINIINDIALAKNYNIWVLSISSSGMIDLTQKLKAYYSEQLIVNTTKGFDIIKTIEENLTKTNIVELSGPTHAEEVIEGLVTLCIASSKNLELAKKVQKIFSNEFFRVYVNDDIYGVELAAALKNIIAIAAGICDGIGYGDNARAALITRGMVEIKRLGLALGAKEETFNGLAGIGDLIVTCSSLHSRNRKYGYLLGLGKTGEESLKEVGMVVEGLNAIDTAYHKAQSLNIDMPIVNEIYQIIHYNKDPKTAIRELMLRKLKQES